MHTIRNHQHINIFLRILFALSRHIIVIQSHVKCLLQLARIGYKSLRWARTNNSVCFEPTFNRNWCRMQVDRKCTHETEPRRDMKVRDSAKTRQNISVAILSQDRNMKNHVPRRLVTRHVSRDLITGPHVLKKNNASFSTRILLQQYFAVGLHQSHRSLTSGETLGLLQIYTAKSTLPRPILFASNPSHFVNPLRWNMGLQCITYGEYTVQSSLQPVATKSDNVGGLSH